MDANGALPPTCVFLHLTKTGGTTLRSILIAQHGPRRVHSLDRLGPRGAVEWLRGLGPADAAEVRAVAGHVPFGIQDAAPFPTATVTLVRDPVDRVLSHYRYVRDDAAAIFHDRVRDGGLDIAGYVRDPQIAPWVHNGQTRLLGGSPDVFAPPSPARSSHALSRLEDGLVLAGVTERFDESVLLMRRVFGWDWPVYERWKVSAGGPYRADLPADLEQEIAERNEPDAELHRRAGELLERRIAEAGATFATEVRLFRALAEARADSPGART